VADVVGLRLTTSIAGAGLIDAIPDDPIEAAAIAPPNGVSGRVNRVEPFEDPGTLRIGRYGWKAQLPTLLSCVAAETRDELGLTHRLLLGENAPNGDAALLAECDAVADPELSTDGAGTDFLDRVRDFTRFLSPPPQTPRSGMSGEVQFFSMGCVRCHKSQFVTADDPALPEVLRDRTARLYSDLLLHDMGSNGEVTGQGDAAMGEVRTAPLWGLSERTRMWHDGRVDAASFNERVRESIALHDVPDGEGQASAQSFASTSTFIQNLVIGFLGSLGRLEFDFDADGDIDIADFDKFLECFTGPGFFYSADSPCAVFDFDQDNDVDDDDYVFFLSVFEGGVGGRVPNGADLPGTPLTVNRNPDGTLLLEWGESCRAEDGDFAVYQGTLGDFDSHFQKNCSTGGATLTTLAAASGSVYFLVVPSNGISEGSYGIDSRGSQRPAAFGSQACAPQVRSDCD